MKSKDIVRFSQPLPNTQELYASGLPILSKIELFPLEKSKVLMRIENIDD